MAISIAMYAPRLVNPITQFVFWICFFCVSHPWLVTWHCMYSRLYHIMRFIKFNDMFTQKTSLSQETLSIFELVIFETLIVIEHKESKSTILTMITYIGEHREQLYIHFFPRNDISNLEYWWSYVWNQQRTNGNMLPTKCSETLNVLRARLRRLTD